MAKKTFCNMCGKPFDFFDAQNDFSIDRFIGFGSVNDEEHLQLELCCDCMDRIIAECKIPPLESDEMNRLLNEYGPECECEEAREAETADRFDVEAEIKADCVSDTADLADKIIRMCIDDFGIVPHCVTVKKVSKDDAAR